MTTVVLCVLVLGVSMTLFFLGLTAIMCLLDGSKDYDTRRTHK